MDKPVRSVFFIIRKKKLNDLTYLNQVNWNKEIIEYHRKVDDKFKQYSIENLLKRAKEIEK